MKITLPGILLKSILIATFMLASIPASTQAQSDPETVDTLPVPEGFTGPAPLASCAAVGVLHIFYHNPATLAGKLAYEQDGQWHYVDLPELADYLSTHPRVVNCASFIKRDGQLRTVGIFVGRDQQGGYGMFTFTVDFLSEGDPAVKHYGHTLYPSTETEPRPDVASLSVDYDPVARRIIAAGIKGSTVTYFKADLNTAPPMARDIDTLSRSFSAKDFPGAKVVVSTRTQGIYYFIILDPGKDRLYYLSTATGLKKASTIAAGGGITTMTAGSTFTGWKLPIRSAVSEGTTVLEDNVLEQTPSRGPCTVQVETKYEPGLWSCSVNDPYAHDTFDLDGDGVPDEEDFDMDGDGIDDLEDDNIGGRGPGLVLGYTDLDGDGFDDETGEDLLDISDQDGDGIPDDEDFDKDGDGIDDETGEKIDEYPAESDEDKDDDSKSTKLDDDSDGAGDDKDGDDTEDDEDGDDTDDEDEDEDDDAGDSSDDDNEELIPSDASHISTSSNGEYQFTSWYDSEECEVVGVVVHIETGNVAFNGPIGWASSAVWWSDDFSFSTSIYDQDGVTYFSAVMSFSYEGSDYRGSRCARITSDDLT